MPFFSLDENSNIIQSLQQHIVAYRQAACNNGDAQKDNKKKEEFVIAVASAIEMTVRLLKDQHCSAESIMKLLIPTGELSFAEYQMIASRLNISSSFSSMSSQTADKSDALIEMPAAKKRKAARMESNAIHNSTNDNEDLHPNLITNNLDILPKELIPEILSYLPFKDLPKLVMTSKVYKNQWVPMVEIARLNQNEVGQNNLNQAIIFVIKNLPMLKRISLRGWETMDGSRLDMLLYFNWCQSLKDYTLIFRIVRMEKMSLMSLAMAAILPHLRGTRAWKCCAYTLVVIPA